MCVDQPRKIRHSGRTKVAVCGGKGPGVVMMASKAGDLVVVGPTMWVIEQMCRLPTAWLTTDQSWSMPNIFAGMADVCVGRTT